MKVATGVDVLEKIVAAKRARIVVARQAVSEEVLLAAAFEIRKHAPQHALRRALERDDPGLKIIAEFKRRSPSKGIIREPADAAMIGGSYESAGAVAISVLTEEDFFEGSLADLRVVRARVSIPILRKDFIVEEYQVHEAAAAGADALLLIVAALDDEQLVRLRRLTEDELGMDALVEVHTRAELDRAAASGAKLIGVNNRDLRTFDVSINTSLELARVAPPDAVLVSESGLTPETIGELAAAGYRAFLVGEALMRAEDPGSQLEFYRNAI